MRVRAVRASEGAKVAPVVLESEDGNTIIWVVDQESDARQDDESDELDMETPKDEPANPTPKGGEL
jgi:hypothetical protein